MNFSFALNEIGLYIGDMAYYKENNYYYPRKLAPAKPAIPQQADGLLEWKPEIRQDFGAVIKITKEDLAYYKMVGGHNLASCMIEQARNLGFLTYDHDLQEFNLHKRSPVMSQETVFEVCIIERPTVKDAEEGKSAKIVLPPTAVIAKSTQDAPLVAALNAKIQIDPSRMEVLVRPFLGR